MVEQYEECMKSGWIRLLFSPLFRSSVEAEIDTDFYSPTNKVKVCHTHNVLMLLW